MAGMWSTDPRPPRKADLPKSGARSDDPRYWRRRARESHQLAQQMHNAAARATMLDIAPRYEAMAKSTERRLALAAKKLG